MVLSCSARGCKNRSSHKDKNISFHKFPVKRPDVCEKWIEEMRLNNFQVTKYSNICSQHFTQDSFKYECNNRVLKEDAVPTLCWVKLQLKAAKVELPSPAGMAAYPLPLPLSAIHPTVSPQILLLGSCPEQHHSLSVSCDHNYTAEASAQHQTKRIDQLEKRVDSLRKKLRASLQKCRRQERQLKRLKAVVDFQRAKKTLHDVLKGIDTIDGL